MFIPDELKANAWYAEFDELDNVFSGYFSSRGRSCEIWAINTPLDIFSDEQRFKSIYIDTLFGRLNQKIGFVKLILSSDFYDKFVQDCQDDNSHLKRNFSLLKRENEGALSRILVRKKDDVDSSLVSELSDNYIVGFCAIGKKLDYEDKPLFFYRLNDIFHIDSPRSMVLASFLRTGAGFESIRNQFQQVFSQDERFRSAAVLLEEPEKQREIQNLEDIRVLIVVGLFEELPPIVNEVFPELHRIGGGSQSYWEGTLKSNNNRVYHLFAVNCDRMGNVDASSYATAGCLEFNPDYVVLLGITGGLRRNKKLKQLGDVVYSTECVPYEYQKIIGLPYRLPFCKKLYRDRPLNCNHMLIGMAEQVNEGEQWNREIPLSEDGSGETRKVKAYGGKMLSGSKVIACRWFLKNKFLDALAVDMESEGVFVGSERAGKSGIAIKGISDWADSTKAKTEEEGARRIAAKAAAQFLRDALDEGTLSPPPLREPRR